MIIEKYDQNGLLLNVNFIDKASADGVVGFRGRVAIVEGEVADAQGRRKPPAVVLEHGVMLEKDGKLALVSGSLDDLADLPTFVEKYKDDFAPGMMAIIYVVNISKPLQVELEGINFALIPMQEGIPWNELNDEAGLQKGDMKKLSSGDKVLTVWKELGGYKAKGDKMALDAALGQIEAGLKRVERGAI
jgi:hypothetical protein